MIRKDHLINFIDNKIIYEVIMSNFANYPLVSPVQGLICKKLFVG